MKFLVSEANIVIEKESDHNANQIDEVINILQNCEYVDLTENDRPIKHIVRNADYMPLHQVESLETTQNIETLMKDQARTIDETHTIDTIKQDQAKTLEATQTIRKLMQESQYNLLDDNSYEDEDTSVNDDKEKAPDWTLDDEGNDSLNSSVEEDILYNEANERNLETTIHGAAAYHVANMIEITDYEEIVKGSTARGITFAENKKLRMTGKSYLGYGKGEDGRVRYCRERGNRELKPRTCKERYHNGWGEGNAITLMKKRDNNCLMISGIIYCCILQI